MVDGRRSTILLSSAGTMTRTSGLPVSRNTLARQVYELLRRQIFDGTLRPGERLVESEIATAVGTSRGPVREAIAMLQRGGLVRSDPFVGASIIDLDNREIVEIYSLRSVLEGYAASLATQRRTPEEIGELRKITSRMRDAKGPRSVARLRELDGEFHGTLVQLAGDEQLWQAWERLRTRIALYHSTVESAFRDGKELARMHDLLIDALQGDDAAATERRVRAQLIANGHEWTAKGQWPRAADVAAASVRG